METNQKVNPKTNASQKGKSTGGSKNTSKQTAGSTKGKAEQTKEAANKLPAKVNQEIDEKQEEQLSTAESQSPDTKPGTQKATDTAVINLEGDALPDLNTYKPKNINLDQEYWSPEESGETKRMIFMKIVQNDAIPDFNDPGEYVEKDCAYFIGQSKQGYQIIKCAAARLVSLCESLTPGGIYDFTYTGRKKNKTNNFESNVFAVNPVMTAA